MVLGIATIKPDAKLILVIAMVISCCIMAGGIILLNLKRHRQRGKISSVKYSHLISNMDGF